ncbi:MAG: hypothetical protein A3C02_04430 [Candidatus Andersenbacteria bacterium RIFCSPHIGHO2_02_FULL_45_11]|uniref:Uncharacterized protein n=1 Tax=Candidatus Andersenbacteria bacterium RIFCSPHIGHO2_12_FULL_45_11 TaxID=1797281 RepID=A0A1G1X2S0_9BACT|nr:MAG: hypothetical protein A2805_02790 [Candidatus Andersenbacteria bacterium RIFCSPHIGHO2_01_FULL_46_36]OGY32156.1 MAG: hypothetical protein A3C02_04430 [Candidatus Andersenbacteria bacterium RIFCSPHIGHO2_02_FULL_45_11]OGY34305.1 MAG: hypothetical protein A3D99_04530 [Candidatus Andersenbacteria bacterium RIFCSPHIGHO2_12_FULL_45_11]
MNIYFAASIRGGRDDQEIYNDVDSGSEPGMTGRLRKSLMRVRSASGREETQHANTTTHQA